MDKKFAVVIVTYNRLALLQECLSCVLGQTYPAFRVIVVNNASTDGTGQYLKQMEEEHPELELWTSPSNLGGAGGFRKGLELALAGVGEWILLIDDDAMIGPDFLQGVAAYSEKMPETAAFSGTVMTDGKIMTDHRRRISHGLFGREEEVPEAEYAGETFVYDITSFCGIVLRKDLASSIGLPHEDFFIRCDDTEYSLRIREKTPIVNINSIALNHKTKINVMNGMDGSGKFDWRVYYGVRNMVYTLLQHGYRLYALRYILTLVKDVIYQVTFRKVTPEVGRSNMRLILSAVSDGRKGKLGKNPAYLP